MVSIPPPDDDYPAAIQKVIEAVLERGKDEGAKALREIAYPRRAIANRPALTREIQGRVFRRDRFRCRYCGGRLIPTPMMELLGGLYPDQFPWQPNWKGGQTHPAILSRSPVVDHVDPGSVGGAWLDVDNLVTACWPCNARKGDISLSRLGWELLPIPQDDWDGLTRYYAALWRAAGAPKPDYHRSWMKALRCGEAPQETHLNVE
jgi:hypothetical protein